VNRQKLKVKILGIKLRNCNLERYSEGIGRGISSLEQDIKEGENPVVGYVSEPTSAFEESGCLGLQP
jgi:hypothetical protein